MGAKTHNIHLKKLKVTNNDVSLPFCLGTYQEVYASLKI